MTGQTVVDAFRAAVDTHGTPASTLTDNGMVYTVRQAEDLSRNDSLKPKAKKKDKDADTRALEKSLSQALGLSVSIHHKGNGGTITVSYKTLEQLEMVARLLSKGR